LSAETVIVPPRGVASRALTQKVHHHLVDLRGVAGHRAEIAGERRAQPDSLGKRLAHHPGQVVDEVTDVHGHAHALHATGEGENLANQGSTALGAAANRIQDLQLLRVVDVLLEQADGEENGGQHVVEVVGDAARERPDALHALRPEELGEELLALGDVGVDHQDPIGTSLRVANERPSPLDVDPRSVLAAVVQFPGPLPALDRGGGRRVEGVRLRFVVEQ
jgi:hypothetical protein